MSEERKKKPLPAHSPFVGMPALLKLGEFGGLVRGAFGISPCLVGSSLLRKDWRDVDVRLILPNDVYCRVFDLDVEAARVKWKAGELVLDDDEHLLSHVAHAHHNRGNHACHRWVSFVRAFSALGAEMTGLPIDFQITSAYVAELLFPKSEHHRLHLWSVGLLAGNEVSQ